MTTTINLKRRYLQWRVEVTTALYKEGVDPSKASSYKRILAGIEKKLETFS